MKPRKRWRLIRNSPRHNTCGVWPMLTGADYGHAARVLQESLRLAPSFLPAANALARVYVRQGHLPQAVSLLTKPGNTLPA